MAKTLIDPKFLYVVFTMIQEYKKAISAQRQFLPSDELPGVT